MYILSPQTGVGVCLHSYKVLMYFSGSFTVLWAQKCVPTSQHTQTSVWYKLFPVVAHSGRKLPVMMGHHVISEIFFTSQHDDQCYVW